MKNIQLATIITAAALCGAMAVEAQKEVQIPLLEEDRPSDFHLIAEGPWDGDWILYATEEAGVDTVVYFCSDYQSSQCLGREFIADGAEPPNPFSTKVASCQGKCKGSEKLEVSKYFSGCKVDTDCTEIQKYCDLARGRASRRASEDCEKSGGKSCGCFAVTNVIGKSSRCKRGSYCKYRCTAEAKGNCGITIH